MTSLTLSKGCNRERFSCATSSFRSRRTGILEDMTTQLRQPVGARNDTAAVGGRFAPKTAPDVDDDQISFNNGTEPGVGAPHDWTTRTVRPWGTQTTTFTRSTETDLDGNTSRSVTVDCDDPSVMLLALKGNAEYWSSDNWRHNLDQCRLWSAEITRQMLTEGHVATGYSDVTFGHVATDDFDGIEGIRAAMVAAVASHIDNGRTGPHVLTYVVAQVRGLRLLQSMAPDAGWSTTLAARTIPKYVVELLDSRFEDTFRVYMKLPRPPWGDGVEWGPQPTAGHATTIDGYDMFVGEHNDLVWRALTETDAHGLSPLKAALWYWEMPVGDRVEMIAAARLI